MNEDLLCTLFKVGFVDLVSKRAALAMVERMYYQGQRIMMELYRIDPTNTVFKGLTDKEKTWYVESIKKFDEAKRVAAEMKAEHYAGGRAAPIDAKG